MKRLIAFIICVTAVGLTLCGCVDNGSNEPIKEPDITTTEATTTEATTTTPEQTTTEATTTTAEEVTTTEEATVSEDTGEESTTTTEATTVPTTATTTEATTTQPKWIITPADEIRYATADLNVRATPEQKGERISHVDKGDEVHVTGWVDNGWARIEFRKSEYFVNGKYLSAEKPVVTTVTTTEATTKKTTVTTAPTTATTVTTPEKPKKHYDFSHSKYDMSAALGEAPLKDLAEGYFKMGVGLTGNQRSNGAVNSAEYMAVVDTHFNSVTLTNLMKPSYLLDKNGCQRNARFGNDGEVAVTFSSIDPTLKWCYENGMQMRGHTLVWHAQTPEWFFREDYDENKGYVDYETMKSRLDSYIKQVVTYIQDKYPGVIYCYDVVNEAVEPAAAAPNSPYGIRTKHGNNLETDNPWYKTLGVDYVELAFTYARKYCDPDIKLFYNDYNTFQSQKRNYIYNLGKYLASKGLIDGIGMQGNWNGSWFKPSDVEASINKFGSLGLEIHISEMCIGCENDMLTEENLKKQAQTYEDYFKIITRCDTDNGGKANITAVTIFGLMDGYVFYDNDKTTYTLFDTNFQPKPNFYSVSKVLESLK